MSTMEWLFWLQPTISGLWGIFLTFAIVSAGFLLAKFILLACALYEEDDARDQDKDAYAERCRANATILRSISKKFNIVIPIFIISALCACCLAPLKDIDDRYKKILLVRGIESKTADKFVSTADKILDLAEEAAQTKIDELKQKGQDQ